jgi:hypothetical protein
MDEAPSLLFAITLDRFPDPFPVELRNILSAPELICRFEPSPQFPPPDNPTPQTKSVSQTEALTIGARSKRASFSRHDVCVLERWFEQHRGCPYPSDDEMAMLLHETSLNRVQIRTWLTNNRQRKLSKGPRDSGRTAMQSEKERRINPDSWRNN